MDRYRPNVTVANLVSWQDRFLIVEELIEGVVRFNQPAGHIEAGESLYEAAIRELEEETGLKATPEGWLGACQYFSPSGVQYLRFLFCYQLDKAPPPLRPQDPQIRALHWFSETELQHRSAELRSPLVLASISQFRQQPMLPLSYLNRLNSGPVL